MRENSSITNDINNGLARLIEQLPHEPGATMRLDCINCGGRNTLTITRLMQSSKVVWNCYKAGCDFKGVRRDQGVSHVRQRLQETPAPTPKRGAPMPDVLSSPRNHPKVLSFLCQNHCAEAFLRPLESFVRIFYDPQQDRVLFCGTDLSGAVGKSLAPWRKPKWIVYGHKPPLFVCGAYAHQLEGRHLVLVEDALSACAVFGAGTGEDPLVGAAILGTNLSGDTIAALRAGNPAAITVCLDSDAGRKALAIRQQLQATLPRTRVFVHLLTGPDLKHLDPVELTIKLNDFRSKTL